MYYRGVIGRRGRGLSTIFEECKCAGLPRPKVSDETGVVKVRFMRPDEAASNFDSHFFYFSTAQNL